MTDLGPSAYAAADAHCGKTATAFLGSLFLLTAVRLLFHVVYLPAYEGPDEPFHLGRAAAFADSPWRDALAGDRLSAAIVSSVRRHPCSANLNRAVGCPLFHGDGAFDILTPARVERDGEEIVNYEAHQPPLFYAALSPVISPVASPERRLLAMRLVSVMLVLAALVFPMRRVWNESPQTAILVLLLLLLPGSSEALARASNDAAVFLWTACVIERLTRAPRSRALILLLALGPLVKLTALPVVVVAVSALWLHRLRSRAILGAVVSLFVFVVQAIRGWSWGGTYELNRAASLASAAQAWPVGLLRSVYTFGKTVFWLGEWSAFRAPLALIAAWFVVAGWLAARQLHSSRAPSPAIPPRAHAMGAAAAFAGLLLMAVLNRRLFGQWGGLGGWYVWGWLPWLAVAPRPAPALGRKTAILLSGFVAGSNALWFAAAIRAYGP